MILSLPCQGNSAMALKLNKMKTLTEQLTDLRSEQAIKLAKKERELTLQVQMYELTGLKFNVVIHDWKATESISIFIENSKFGIKFDRFKIKEYYDKICTVFAPVNVPIPTANKSFENFAPVRIDIDNNFNETCFYHETLANVKFSFAGGIEISFKFPVIGGFSKDVLIETFQELKPHNKTVSGRMGKKLYGISGFDRINFAASHYTTYCSEGHKDEVQYLMNIAFTGEYGE